MNVTVHNCALSDRDGTIEFYLHPRQEGSLIMSVVQERSQGTPISVPTKKLSGFFDEPVDLLKMDIEGAEHMVLRELAESGKLSLIKEMHLEYHHHIIREQDNISITLDLLERNGFGYQIEAEPRRLIAQRSFQDIATYAYRK